MVGKVYISNAFSLNMLPEHIKKCVVHIEEVSLERVKEILNTDLEVLSAVGHQSTATVLSELLEREIPANRIPITLTPDDILIVFQLLVRLEEGKVLTKEEIKQLKYKFFVIEIKY
jgi:hypothetical protein